MKNAKHMLMLLVWIWMDAAATILNTRRDLRFIWISQGDKNLRNPFRDDNFDTNIVSLNFIYILLKKLNLTKLLSLYKKNPLKFPITPHQSNIPSKVKGKFIEIDRNWKCSPCLGYKRRDRGELFIDMAQLNGNSRRSRSLTCLTCLNWSS